MEVLHLAATENTPEITLDHLKEIFSMSGESRPENVRNFYEPVMEWLDGYSQYLYFMLDKFEQGTKELNFNFNFEYFNSSSAKYILDILNAVKAFDEKFDNLAIKVNWHYEEFDEDMQEAGEEFQKMSGLPFTFVKVS